MENKEISKDSNYQPRKGWDELFRIMHENGDDKLLIDDVFKDENFEVLLEEF
jgi:hypothetical protein